MIPYKVQLDLPPVVNIHIACETFYKHSKSWPAVYIVHPDFYEAMLEEWTNMWKSPVEHSKTYHNGRIITSTDVEYDEILTY